jgi:hypothetical protein
MIELVGTADGPLRFVPELGCKTPTFTVPAGGKSPALDYHVPLEKRGDFRPTDLANYKPENEYRTDAFGRVLCYGLTKAGNKCIKRAQNRYPRCEFHGGRLHPLDKVVKDNEDPTPSLSRYRQFQAGQITVDDLDDEELAACGFRAKDGRIYKPKNVPREMAQAFTRAIYERANTEIRSLAVEAAKTMGEIMLNRTIEPDIRLKAAITLVERNLGKTPTVVALTGDKPFEEIFDDITHGAREDSRKRRAIESERIYDAEFTDIDPNVVDDKATPDVGESSTQTGGNTDPSDQLTEDPEPSARDDRLFARNPAILAQTLEIKPFEYDLSDNTEDIKKATRKRYATRAVEMKDGPYIRQETPLPNGNTCIKHVEQEAISKPKRPKPADLKRKAYTLSDF